MRSFLRAAMLMAAFVLPALSHAALISGDVSGGGSFAGAVTRDDAWVESNPVDGDEVNFWTLTANAGDTLSLEVLSPYIEFGISIYQGLVDDFDLILGFDNAGDFGDLTYVAGTPFFGSLGTTLLDIVLPTSGVYTIAVGGEEGGHAYGSFAYNMDVEVAPVPLPAAVWLLGSGLLGFFGFGRRRS